jgi:A/G-specific adenine glycosylase
MRQNLFPRKPKVKSYSVAKDKKPASARVLAGCARRLLAWYDRNRRILPWRALPGTAIDPYQVWLSEIMLQQTTVAAVGPYFHKFVKRWPTVAQLAAAPLDEIMQMWAGLGYYRRARLLHQCAQAIATRGGQFPSEENELLQLPGFGPYTAAAVAAIAFDRRANVVDGNVERVVARLFAIRTPLPQAKPEIRAAAETLLPHSRHGDYAQALMDLGATICTPRNPKCGLCPVNTACRAHAMGIEEKLPTRLAKKAKPIRRAIAFMLVNKKNEIFLRRRPDLGLLGGMMEVPSSEWKEGAMPDIKRVMKDAPMQGKWRLLPGQVKHVFTHFELQISVAAAVGAKAPGGKWVPLNGLGNEALPSVMRKIIRHALEAV